MHGNALGSGNTTARDGVGYASPLFQCLNDTLIAHLPSPHRQPGPLQRQSRGLCRHLSLQDWLFPSSYAASNINGKGIAGSHSHSAGPTLPCQTDGEQESTGDGMRLTSLHLRLLFTSSSSYVSSRPSQLCSDWPVLVSLQVSFDKASFILCLFLFPMILFTLCISALNFQSFSGIILEGLILSSFKRNQPEHSGWRAGQFFICGI